MSSKKNRELEVTRLKVILAKNDYPLSIIKKETDKLKNRSKPPPDKTSTAVPPEANTKVKKFWVLP